MIPEIDYSKLSCDNVDEMHKMFGIGSARNKIITELLNFSDLASLNSKHLELIADEMISSGSLGKISRTGANRRIGNALHSIANFGQAKVLEQAAVNGAKANVETISSSLMVGDIPRIGTDFNPVALDIDFIQKNKLNVMDVVNDMLQE